MIKYLKHEKLGEGAYGVVYRSSPSTNPKQQVAIKRFLIDDSDDNDSIRGCLSLKELDAFSRLEHVNINRLVEIRYGSPYDKTSKLSPIRDEAKRDDKVYLITEIARFSFEDLIYRRETPISHFKRGMYQILSGLYYMHTNYTVHRDIKPQNLLCFYDSGVLTVKITDFGLTKAVCKNAKSTLKVAGRDYRAPEILLWKEGYAYEVDIWSAGCVFFEMIAHRKQPPQDSDDDLDFEPKSPFRGDNEYEIMQDILRVLGTPQKEVMEYLTSECSSARFSRSKGIDIASHLQLSDEQIDEFNQEIIGGIPNGGTFDQFVDLLKGMLCIDHRKRLTAWECLNHPFFDHIPEQGSDESESEYYGLYKQKLIKPQYHTLTRGVHPERKRHLMLLLHIEDLLGVYKQKTTRRRLKGHPGNPLVVPKQSYFYNQIHRIIFLAMDIYERCIFDGTVDPHMLLQVCIYIAIKYLCDAASPSFADVFSHDGFKEYKARDIERLEEKILKVRLKFKIYRPILYDILDPSIIEEITPRYLFMYMIETGEIYGRSVISAAKFIETNRSLIRKHYEESKPKSKVIIE